MKHLFDYAPLLFARARYVPPREDAENPDTVLGERNRACRLAWLQRWHHRFSYPDAWLGPGLGRARQFHDLDLHTKREAARAWMAEMHTRREAMLKSRGVLTLKRKEKNGGR